VDLEEDLAEKSLFELGVLVFLTFGGVISISDEVLEAEWGPIYTRSGELICPRIYCHGVSLLFTLGKRSMENEHRFVIFPLNDYSGSRDRRGSPLEPPGSVSTKSTSL